MTAQITTAIDITVISPAGINFFPFAHRKPITPASTNATIIWNKGFGGSREQKYALIAIKMPKVTPAMIDGTDPFHKNEIFFLRNFYRNRKITSFNITSNATSCYDNRVNYSNKIDHFNWEILGEHLLKIDMRHTQMINLFTILM